MLSEDARNDLAGLVSGFGTQASDQRARELAARDPVAAEYLRELQILGKALDDHAAAPVGAMDPVVAERVCSGAYARWRQRRRRRWVTPMAVAAGLLLCAFGLRHLATPAQPEPFARVAIRTTGAFLGTPTADSEELEPGDRVVTRADQRAVVRFAGVTCALDGNSEAVFSTDRIDLTTGFLFLQAARPIHVQAGPLTAQSTAGQSQFLVSPTMLSCSVHGGTVTLNRGGEQFVVSAGQRLVCSTLVDGECSTDIPPEPVPLWVPKLFEMPLAP